MLYYYKKYRLKNSNKKNIFINDGSKDLNFNKVKLLYRDLFALALFVKLSEQAGTFREGIAVKYCVPEHQLLVFLLIITVPLY